MKKFLITGAPGAGKSTYVKENHGDNDIIYDWDDLFVALTGKPSHSEGTEGQQHVVNKLRYDVIRASENANNIDTLWVISSKPSDAIIEALGEFEEIHLNVEKDEAKERVAADDSRVNKDAENEKIENYFSEERKMAIKNEREYRDMTLAAIDVELEQERDEMIVKGYATTFNNPYVLFESDEIIMQEVVDKNAFDGTDMSDVIMQYDHEGRVFARASNNTLKVIVDDIGLLIEAFLGGTEIGRNLYQEIKGGYTTKMSFGFVVDGEKEERSKAPDGRLLITRTITHVRKLYDVSAVSIPANDATSISVRNLTNGAIERIQAERLEAQALELKRKKMLMRAKML